MDHKVVLVADPGIDTAFALALALLDPEVEVLGIAATAGNVGSDQATRNVHVVVEQIDPARWPRIGAALPVEYDMNGTRLHGPDGLGGSSFPCAKLHHTHPGDKLINDLVRQYPKDVTLIVLGPLTTVARAMDRDSELAHLVHRIICVGGAWHEAGNATAAAEFHFYCDPQAARQVVRCGAPLTLIPLDVTRKLLLAPTELLELPSADTPAGRFLRKIAPHGIGTTSNLYGIEGFHLKDVLGIVALTLPAALSTRPMVVDVETRGELTRGMSVVDTRWTTQERPNVDLAVGVDVAAVRKYMEKILQ